MMFLLSSCIFFVSYSSAEANKYNTNLPPIPVGGRIAVVDAVMAYQQCDATKQNDKQIESTMSKKREQLDEIWQAKDKLENKYRRDEVTLSESQKEERIFEIRRKGEDYNLLKRKLEEEIQASHMKFAKVQEPKVEQAISEIKKDLKINILLRKQQGPIKIIEYVDEEYEITRHVIERINRNAKNSKNAYKTTDFKNAQILENSTTIFI